MPEALKKATGAVVAFGDVVQRSKERSQEPEADGFDRYVGLEHLEPGDLQIRNWGDISDGVTFTSIFRPGQVLFGKRRAYQRKVAVADFSGVCSGDIYVLEPKGDHLLPELLPFICQSERFYDYVISMSQGGLSPRVNWKALTEYELALPPLDEQRRVAEVLQAARVQSDRLQQLCTAARMLYGSTAAHLFSQGSGYGIKPHDWKPIRWKCAALEELVVADAPIRYGIVQVGDFDPEGVPTLAINNLDGDFVEGVHKTGPEIEGNYRRSRVAPNDVLISIKATIGEIAIVPPAFEGNISRDLARVRIKDTELRRRFFYHLYKSPRFRRYLQSLVVGSTRAELSIGLLRTMEVPFPSIDKQDQLIAKLDAIEAAIAMLKERQESARDLMSIATNQLLERGLCQ